MAPYVNNHTPENDGFELASLFGFLWQKKWRIIFSVILLTSLSYLYIKSKPKIYSASSTILLNENVNYQSGGNDSFGSKTGERLDTFIEFIRSRQFTQQVIEKLKLQESSEFKKLIKNGKRIVDIQTAISVFSNNLKIAKITNTEMLKVTYEAQIAHIAAEVVNQLGPIFFKYQGQIRKYKDNETTRWLDGQLSELKRELDAAENALELFMLENGLINLENQVELTKTEIGKLIDHKLQHDKNLATEKSYIQQITQANNDLDKLVQIPVILNDPLLKSIAARLFEKKLILEEVSKRYKFKHHKYIAANSAVKTVQSNFDLSLSQVLDGIKHTYNSTKIRQQELAEQLDKVRMKHMQLSEHDIELATLERQVAAKLKLYEVFVSRLQEMEIQKDLDKESEFAVVDFAQVPTHPSKPKMLIGLIFSFILSSILSIAFWLFVHLVADKKTRLKQLLKKHNVTLLAEIPKSPKINKKESKRKTKANKNEILYAEAIRSLRAELMVSSNHAHIKSIAFTPVLASKQNSRLSIDLAESFAHIEKTLLIDCDLRNPTIGKEYGLEQLTPGLTNFLSRRNSFSETRYRPKSSQFSIMPSGPIPNDPLMYFTKLRFGAIVKKLASLFERTIIETPPVNSVSDILVISKSVDAVVLRCDLDITDTADLSEAIQRLLNVGVPLLGVVFERGKSI